MQNNHIAAGKNRDRFENGIFSSVPSNYSYLLGHGSKYLPGMRTKSNAPDCIKDDIVDDTEANRIKNIDRIVFLAREYTFIHGNGNGSENRNINAKSEKDVQKDKVIEKKIPAAIKEKRICYCIPEGGVFYMDFC